MTPHPHPCRPWARRPVAVAAAIALSTLLPAASAAQKHWTFIGGCAAADWFGMLSGPNADGTLFCWSSTAGGPATAFPPLAGDDVFILLPNASSTLLVEFADPVRGNPTGQAASLTMAGSSSHAVGLRMARGSLVTGNLTLGSDGSARQGRLDLTGGTLSVTGTASVFGGTLRQTGGSLVAPGRMLVASQAGTAAVELAGGTLLAGQLDVGALGSGSASFSQLAGTLTTLQTNLGVLGAAAPTTMTVTGTAARWNNAGRVSVGAAGSTLLSLEGGARATAGEVFIGGAVGGPARAALSGSGTQWDVSGLLAVGQVTAAELAVGSGTTVTAGSLRVDGVVNEAGAEPLAWARVQGGRVQAQSAVIAGQLGAGGLEVSAGGLVQGNFGVVGDERRSRGTARVSGAGSRWESFLSLVVGDDGSGALTVADGGLALAPVVTLGQQRGTSGEVTVEGAGSRLAAADVLTVGEAGRGTLTLRDGGRADSGSASVGFSPYTGDRNAPTSRAVVSGGRWDNAGLLQIGQGGVGELAVAAAGEVRTGALTLGGGDAARGSVDLRGQGSWLEVAGRLVVGQAGVAEASVRNQATLRSGSAVIGAGATSVAQATLGPRGLWVNAGELVVAEAGSGTLTIDGDGARLQTGALRVGGAGRGQLSLQAGELIVDRDARVERGQWALGPQGLAQVAGRTLLGDGGQLLLDGGRLVTGALAMTRPDALAWKAGTLEITGADGITLDDKGLPTRLTLRSGQTLAVAQALRVNDAGTLTLEGGGLGAGRLTLEGGRVVVAGDGNRLDLAGIGLLEGRGEVDGPVSGGADARIAAGGALTLGSARSAAGYDVRGTLEVGSHVVTLRDADGAALGRTTTLGAGGRLVGEGGLVLGAGRLLRATGEAAVAGTLRHAGSIEATGGRLWFEGDVSGGGSFAGQVGFAAGLAPGDGIGSMRFQGGDAVFGPDALLSLQIDGTTPLRFDRLLDLGTMSFGGALALDFGSGFAPTADVVRLRLLDFDAFEGGFDPLRTTVSGLDLTRWQVDTARLGQDGVLVVASLATALPPVPEPGTWALWLAGLGGVLWRRRVAAQRCCQAA